MAPKIRTVREHTPKSPAKIDRGYFYPGEVVRILGLEGLDYHQLRRLFRLLAGSGEPGAGTNNKWARFTFRDLVGLKAAIYLGGGVEALQPGRRLRLKEVERICKRLREEFGVLDPLVEVAFRRDGRAIVAQVQGVSFEPLSGQLVIAEAEKAVARYLESRPDRTAGKSGRAFKRKLRQDVEELRLPGRSFLPAQAALPL
jgi:hypothetical protein